MLSGFFARYANQTYGGASKRVHQSSKSQTLKNLGIKSPKNLKCQAASLGNKNLNNQSSYSLVSAQAESNGSKLPRIDASSSVKMGNLAQEQGDGYL